MQTVKLEEIKGSLSKNTFIELIAESISHRLTGSFRLSNGENKIIVYLRDGKVIFATSNARKHRIFEMLLSWGQISQSTLANLKDVGNDFSLASQLIENKIFTQSDIDSIFNQQIISVIQTAINWQNGEWSFSHLARIKDSINFNADIISILLNFGRGLSDVEVFKKLGEEETFAVNGNYHTSYNLNSEEGFILSRLSFPMKVDQLNLISGFSKEKIFRILFTLWLCGLVKRENWNSAFNDKQIEHILSAKLKLSEVVIPQKTEEKNGEISQTESEESSNQTEVQKTEEELLMEFLARAENSISHYQVLDIEQTAELTAIKQAYFYLAKTFHPDKFHKEIGTERHKRLQDAFTKLAQAYETLKDKNARELYDFKLKRRLATLEKENLNTTVAKTTQEKQKQEEAISQVEKADAAKRWFDKGFECLMENDYENAITLLARAVLLDDTSARYHAYYGKALGGVKKHKYQAEQELQKAIKIESKNAGYRIMLAELYLDFGLPKRAEGELNRLLTIEPNNKEAQAMLNKIS